MQARDLDGVGAILGELNGKRLQNLLDRPIDDLHNTMFHKAVANGIEAGVQALIHHGAKSSLRNLRGDVAYQWFMWPMLGRAAAAARKIRHAVPTKAGAGYGESRVIPVMPKPEVSATRTKLC